MLFYDWKLLKIGIHGNEVFIFTWDLKSCLKGQQNAILVT